MECANLLTQFTDSRRLRIIFTNPSSNFCISSANNEKESKKYCYRNVPVQKQKAMLACTLLSASILAPFTKFMNVQLSVPHLQEQLTGGTSYTVKEKETHNIIHYFFILFPVIKSGHIVKLLVMEKKKGSQNMFQS